MSFDIDHFTVMKEPVENGRSNHRITKKACASTQTGQSTKLLFDVMMVDL